jgi:hypothetical protein
MSTDTTFRLLQPQPRADTGAPRLQYERTYLLLHPGADGQFVQRMLELAPVVSRWTIGGSADDAGIGSLNVRRVIALRPGDWPASDGVGGLEDFFRRFYPGVTFWPLDWENDVQLKGRLLAYSLLETGFSLAYPTTHVPPQIVESFGDPLPERESWQTWLGLSSSWFTCGDEVLAATDGVVVEAGWHGNQGGLGYRVRVKTTAPDGREVCIRYAPFIGEDGFYVGIGDSVAAGQKLGRPGQLASGEVLRVEVQVEGAFVDPALLIDWPAQAVRADPMPMAAPRIMGDKVLVSPQFIDRQAAESKAVIIDAGRSSAPRPETPTAATAVILPPVADRVERLDWRAAAAIAASPQMWLAEADASAALPQAWHVIAVNPTAWGEDDQARLRRRASGTVRTVEATTPWEMALHLLPELEGDIALAQTDSRWASYDFGEQPGPSGSTIGNYGCFVTALAIVLRKHYRRDVTPPILDKLLVAARAAYFDDNMLAWEGVVPLFPLFDDYIKDNRMRSAAELQRLLEAGWEVILRRADGGHFVYLEAVAGDTLQIIDTWDGTRRQKPANAFAGVRAAHLRPRAAPSTARTLLVGLHDARGAEWMVAQGITEGCCLVHHVVQRQPVQLDYRHIQSAGITVICRLNWGYADGTGTLPRPQDKAAFIDAVVRTMRVAKGVDYFHVGNEPNNPQEWPGFGRNDEFPLTPAYVAGLYNAIWRQVVGQAKMGPPPLDPYYGPHSDNGEWWTALLAQIEGADALFLHAKTQTNDPAEVWSQERFSDDPLTWQYLHLRTVETALAARPERFRSLPVFITELNPQHLTSIGGALGWQPDNSAWVDEALSYLRQLPIHGVVFYRYERAGDQAPFGLEDKPAILRAILNHARTAPRVSHIADRPAGNERQ